MHTNKALNPIKRLAYSIGPDNISSWRYRGGGVLPSTMNAIWFGILDKHSLISSSSSNRFPTKFRLN